MKLLKPPHPLRPGGQKGRPKMQRPLFLSKATTGHNTYTRRIQQPETIEFIGRLIGGLGGGEGAGWEVEGWEEVHGTLFVIY